MGTVEVFTKTRAKAIEDNTIVSASVNAAGDLTFVKNNGSTVAAGNIKGPQGDEARYKLPNNATANVVYLRLATLDGINASNGANYNFILSGLGDFGTAARSTILVHAAQRKVGGISLKAWAWDLRPGVALYTKALGDFLFEIWIKLPSYNAQAYLVELASWSTTRNLDGMTTVVPSSLVESVIQIGEANVATSPTVNVTGNGAIETPYQLTVKAIDDATIKTGVLEATYRGGKAKVKIDGVLSSTAYSWLTPYNPSGSREVRLIKTVNGWIISGQVEDNTAPLTINHANWDHYAVFGAGTWASHPKATKLPSGLVVLTGMLGSIAAATNGQVIATIPEGFRPENHMLFPTSIGETAAEIRIDRNTGEISVNGNGWPSGFLTLSGIAYWTPGVAQWTNIGSGGSSWGANFGKDAAWTTQYGEPGFWKDPYGFVWFRGLARVAVATTVDSTALINLPATHRPGYTEHHRTSGNATFAAIKAEVTAGLKWLPNSPGAVGTYLSLSSVIVKTADADANNNWHPRQPNLLNSWTPYGSGYTPVNFTLREDGLRMLYGLLKGGTLVQAGLVFPSKEFWPSQSRITIPTVSNNTTGRITLYPDNPDGDQLRGCLFMDKGVNPWYSIDSRVWVP